MQSERRDTGLREHGSGRAAVLVVISTFVTLLSKRVTAVHSKVSTCTPDFELPKHPYALFERAQLGTWLSTAEVCKVPNAMTAHQRYLSRSLHHASMRSIEGGPASIRHASLRVLNTPAAVNNNYAQTSTPTTDAPVRERINVSPSIEHWNGTFMSSNPGFGLASETSPE